MSKIIEGYKLFSLRKDGSIRSLFINKGIKLPIGKWIKAEEHPTKGFAFRPGWHATLEPIAPHLSKKNRVWAKVKMKEAVRFNRPESQGGTWLLAKWIKIEKILNE